MKRHIWDHSFSIASIMERNTLCLWSCLLLVLNFACAYGDQDQHTEQDHRENITQTLYQKNNNFAFQIYKGIVSKMESPSENVFFSPLSVSMALAALSLGAGGETHQQLLNGLGFNTSVSMAEDIHQAFLTLLQTLNERTGVDLETGTAVYVHDTFKPNPTFLEKVKHFYLSDGFSVDFSNTKKTINQINSYVSEKTHGKMNEYLKKLDSKTLMLLLSYIYFKGKWAIQFDPKETREDVFYVDEHTTVPVQMMYSNNMFYFYVDNELSAVVLSLQYNDHFSMMLVLPKNNLTALEEAILPHHITKWQEKIFTRRYSQIYIPKVSLKTLYFLKDILFEMGMRDMFACKANFSGISEDDQLLVSKVVHQATLDVDEAGSTATAATGVLLSPRSFPSFKWELKFDRPFMVFIIDQKTKTIMFMGKIVNPTK